MKIRSAKHYIHDELNERKSNTNRRFNNQSNIRLEKIQEKVKLNLENANWIMVLKIHT